MASRFGKAYEALLALSAVFALGALLTLVPNPQASWPNILGYSSLCTFAPAATFACGLLAGITCVIRARLVKRVRGPIAIPLLVFAILAAGFAVSTAAWAREKAHWTEASSSATEPSPPAGP